MYCFFGIQLASQNYINPAIDIIKKKGLLGAELMNVSLLAMSNSLAESFIIVNSIFFGVSDIGISTELTAVLFSQLEKNTRYIFEIFNPRTGDIVRSETITSSERGEWNFTSDKPIGRPLPTMEDWIVRLAKSS